MQGDVFRKQIEAHPSLKKTPIVFSVSYYNFKDLLHGEQGITEHDFLIKPICFRDLISTIENVVSPKKSYIPHCGLT